MKFVTLFFRQPESVTWPYGFVVYGADCLLFPNCPSESVLMVPPPPGVWDV